MAKGTKRAVLVGCNYYNTQFKLNGCVNDVKVMKKVIEGSYGFLSSNLRVLVDEPGTNSVKPTGANIKAALNAMVKEAKAGDILFFYFSGHGTGIPTLEPGHPFKQDEAIVPCDLNVITDVDFRHLVNRLPEGATFTILSDSCHSGGLIDKEKEQIGPFTFGEAKDIIGVPKPKSINFDFIHNIINTVSNTAHQATNIADHFLGFFGKDVSLKFYPHFAKGILELHSLGEDEGILISGCQPNETSFDAFFANSSGELEAHGAFTYVVKEILNEKKTTGVLNYDLVKEAREKLKLKGYMQHPCLYCSDKNAEALFLGGVHIE